MNFFFPRSEHKEGCSGLWRSEDVVRLDLFIQREVLHSSIFRIGLLGKAQFVDLNEDCNAFARPFVNDVRRCEDALRKISYIESEIVKEGDEIQNLFPGDVDMCASVEEIEDTFLIGQIDHIEERIQATCTSLSAMTESLEGLQAELNQNREIMVLYQRLRDMYNDNESSETINPHDSSFRHLSRLSSVIGLINSSQVDVLYRICYRITRGNAFISIDNEAEPFVNPKTGEQNAFKSTFSILSSSSKMMTKVRKLISSLNVTLYSLEEIESRGMQLLSNEADGEDTEMQGMPSTNSPHSSDTLLRLIDDVKDQKENLLLSWYEEHRLYKQTLRVEKSVLSTMNLCSFAGATCTASVWIAKKYDNMLEHALNDAVTSSGEVQSIVTIHVPQKNPPTYFETNKFTESFQSIVDSYGMARYKEVNPGVFTIITFPYLFGIMYGDIGHGVLLLLLSLFFIWKERVWNPRQLNEMVGMIFGGRYLLLLMSLFAIYMGFLYNDFFGFSVNIFPSGYIWASLADRKEGEVIVYPVSPNGKPSVKPNHVYAFGLDVAWAETENKLEFYNSVKMKCAVIVGVVQMFAGVILSLNNHIYRRDLYRILFLTIPEFFFLLCTFGYMSILIIVKWCTNWEDTSKAPSILETMTSFFLSPGTVSQPLFKGQAGLQVFLLIFAFIMVPIMLCGMPIVEYRKYKQHQNRLRVLNANFPVETEALSRDYPVAPTAESSRSNIFHRGDSNGTSTGAAPATHTENHQVVSDNDEPFVFGAGSGEDIIATEESLTLDDEDYENFEFSEVIIHYMIHTIEYVLSSVSNTASYLRLWALSLAHAQLSEVFFTFAIVKLLDVDSTGFAVGFGVLVWLAVTFGVLVGMEALSAFLHALRLHWVEFQNKFYVGDGIPLEPLNFATLDK